MAKAQDLRRFIAAQEGEYDIAIREIINGRKSSHWMWFIFPQIAGLGYSETSRYYAIKDRDEAQAYLKHPVLGKRLVEISKILLCSHETEANRIFGSPDDLKLKSSMTLFATVPDAPPVFTEVLAKFFNGVRDSKTLAILNNEYAR